MFESLLIAISICIDSFALAMTYGVKKIKIPTLILFLINVFCISILGFSVFLGNTARYLISDFTAILLSSIILIVLGLVFIIEGYIKHLFTKARKDNKIANFKIPKLGIIVDVALDYTKADLDISGDISFKESIYVALILSIDSLGAGFGYALGGINIIWFLAFVFVINFFCLLLGLLFGKRIPQYSSGIKISILPGIILIILGILKWF